MYCDDDDDGCVTRGCVLALRRRRYVCAVVVAVDPELEIGGSVKFGR